MGGETILPYNAAHCNPDIAKGDNRGQGCARSLMASAKKMAFLNEEGGGFCLCFSTFLESNEDELPRGRIYVRSPAELLAGRHEKSGILPFLH